ncbi:MAG: rod shape-determining protein, partial [Chloroflexi bacterium]|nr:rod shape-determining protein [Chloroflexota bacterium]
EAAEDAKIRFGHADPNLVDPTEVVEIASFGYQERQQVTRRDISLILRARVEELAELLQAEIERSGHRGLLPAGVVLTGGSANLRGLAPVLAELLDMPIRVGVPRGVQGLGDTLRNPAFSTSAGLLFWGLRHGVVGEEEPARRPSFEFGGWWGRFGAWLRDLLPQ